MDIKKILIIIISAIVVIAAGFGIFKLIESFNKDYDSPLEVEYSYYKVYTNGKYGVLNKKGDLVVPANYDDILIPNPSKPVFICQYNYNNATEECDYIIVNDKAEELFKNFENVEPIPVTGIIGSVPYEKWGLRYKQDNKFGLLTIDGKKVTEPIYEEISSVPYKEGVFLVKENGKYGVVNNKGALLVKTEYDNIIGDGYYSEETGYKASCFVVTKGEYTGYISEKGDVILDDEYDSVLRIKDLPGRYIIAKKNGQYGLLDDTKIVIGFNYQELYYDESANLIIIKRNKNYGVTNIDGNKVLPLEFSDITIEGIYIVATKNGAIEKYMLDGKVVTNDVYSRVEKTTGEYYVSIDKNYNYGVLDKDMNVVVENKYEYLEYLFDDMVIVRNNAGKYGVINLKGDKITEFEYDVMHIIKDTNIVQASIVDANTVHLYNKKMERIVNEKNAGVRLYNDYLKVTTGKETKYYNKDGELVETTEVYPDNKLFSYNENEKFGFKNKDGEVVVEAQYDRVTEFNKNGFAGIKQDGKWGTIDEKGNVVVEPTYEINDAVDPEFLGVYYRSFSNYVETYYTK